MTFWVYDWNLKCYFYTRPDGTKVPTKSLDGIVEGTNGSDLIDDSYVDKDGDEIDNNDAVLGSAGSDEDIVDAFDGNDTVYAGLRDDTVYGGSGDDYLDGQDGNDVIYGDSTSGLTKLSSDGNYTVAVWDLSDLKVHVQQHDDYPFPDNDIDGESTHDVAGSTFTIKADATPNAVGINDNDSRFGDGDWNQTLAQTTTLNGIDEQAGDRFTPEYSYKVTSSSGETITIYVGEFDGNDMVGILSDKPLVPGETYTFVCRESVYPEVPYADLADGFFETTPTPVAGGDDTLVGGNGDDTLFGERGNDELQGGLGNDYLDGGEGDDTIIGGDGDDTIRGGDGDDSLRAGDGIDRVEGGRGDDIISGGAGADKLFGGEGDDTINANQDGDHLDGGEGDDFLRGNIGDDTIYGGDGEDTIVGGLSADYIEGGKGDDSINSAGGDDTVHGGDGDDTINGGDALGNDWLSGGADADTFALFNGMDTVLGGSEGSDFDTLDLRGSVPEGGSYRIVNVSQDDDPGDTVNGGSANDGIDGTVLFFDKDGAQTGTLKFENIEQIIPCFTPGTLIATPRGEVPVENLRQGDRVITRDNGIQEIRWVGEKRLGREELMRQRELRPVLIRKGALGHGLPERDMLVSPNHRMLAATDETALYFEEREVLVAAKHMCHAEGIDQVETLGVSYIHFMFDRHEVVLSDGTWSESFQPGDYTLKGIDGEQRSEILKLFPELEDLKGIESYRSARRSLKRHEAGLLLR